MARAAVSLLAAVLALGVGASAQAAPELSVSNFTGPGWVNVRNQIVRSVCDVLDCVPPAKGKPKKGGPAVLNGKVVVRGKHAAVHLWLVSNGRERLRKVFPVAATKKGMELGADNLDKAANLILNALGAKRTPPPAPTPPPETASSSTSSPEPAKAQVDDQSKVATEAKAGGGASGGGGGGADSGTSKAAQTAPEAGGSGGYTPPTILAGAHFDVLLRSFAFAGLTTANLNDYRGPNLAARIHLESYPLTRLTSSAANGLGLEANFSFTVGMKAVVTTPAAKIGYPSQLMRADALLKFRYAFRSLGGLAIIPGVGFSRTSFSVSEGDDGSTLTSLPNVAYLGLKLGLGAEMPLVGNKLLVGTGVYFIPVFGAGAVISPTYFQEGSAWGLAFKIGAGYRIIPALEARLDFQLERYGLSFKTLAGDSYVASGASDLYLGGNLGLAWVF